MLLARPFVFMRHGETPLNRAGLIGGSSDVPLTARGRAQARAAAPLLAGDWSVAATSTRQRAQQTLALAAPHPPRRVLAGLDERHWGQLERAPLREQPPYLATPPGGESWPTFVARVTAALNTLLEHHERPLIVAHSGVYRVIRYLVRGTPDGPRLPNAHPLLIRPGPLGWHFIALEPTHDFADPTR